MNSGASMARETGEAPFHPGVPKCDDRKRHGSAAIAASPTPFKDSSGSQQLRLFRRAIRDGATIEDAAGQAGMSLGEARIHAAADQRNPPPPEAFALLYDPAAPLAAAAQKEADMARGRKAREPKQDAVEVVKDKDFERAAKVFRNDIRPANTQAAKHRQTSGEGYKVIKKECHIRSEAARAAFKIYEREDADRDDFLRGFVGMVNEMMGRTVLTFHGDDLVDQMEGESDLMADDFDVPDDTDDFEEMSEEELAGQAGRAAANLALLDGAEPAGALAH